MIKKVMAYQSLLLRIWDAQAMKSIFPMMFVLWIIVGFVNGTLRSYIKGPIYVYLLVFFVYKLYVGNRTIYLVPVSRRFEAINMYLTGILIMILLYLALLLFVAIFMLLIIVITFLAGVLEFGGESVVTNGVVQSFGYTASFSACLLLIYVSAISAIIVVKKQAKCILVLVELLIASLVLLYVWQQLSQDAYLAFTIVLAVFIIAIPMVVIHYSSKQTKITIRN